MEAVEKPAPRYNPAARPVASPRVAPPANAPTELSRPPVETKPIAPQTPSGIRLKPSAPALATPPPSAAATPASEDQTPKNPRPRRPAQIEGEKPAPSPTGSTAPE
jgi:hypothetical protein